MARRKNIEINKRALEFYALDVLTSDDLRKEFNQLEESAKEKKVNGYISRNKGLFVGVKLSLINSLNGAELSKLKQDLQNYLIEIDDAIKNFNEREITEIENKKEQLKKEYKREIEKLDKKIEDIKKKKEETKKEETKKEEQENK